MFHACIFMQQSSGTEEDIQHLGLPQNGNQYSQGSCSKLKKCLKVHIESMYGQIMV